MALFPHMLHLFQKPAAGTGFMLRKPTYNYTHSISAMGWYDTASCNLRLTEKEAEIAFESWIGNRVAIYVDNPVVPVWEGLIARITPEFGNVVPTRSLDNMFNRVKGVAKYASNASLTQTAAGDNANSQAIYGIKEGSVDGRAEGGAGAATRLATLRDFIFNWQGFPQTSLQFNPAGRIVRLELQGFYHTLEWENPRVATNNNRNASVLVTQTLAALANGTTFFDNSVTTYVETNTTFTINELNTQGETAWQQFLKVTEPGDTSFNKWVIGILPTDPNTGARYLYYRNANTAIEYTANARDGARIRNQFGGLVNAWDVKPDRSLRVNDILIGWNGLGDDPREIYIESVNYDAESGQVALAGADDITTDGIIQAKRYHQMHNSRFGPKPREFV